MGFTYRHSRRLAPGTRLNLSTGGASISQRVGRFTASTSGRGSFRIAPGFSYRFSAADSTPASLIVLAVMCVAWLVVLIVRLCIAVVWLPLRWAWAVLVWAVNLIVRLVEGRTT
jgi:hypothetical protein